MIKIFLYILSAFLYVFSFPNFSMNIIGGMGVSFPWMAWVCLVPLIIAVKMEQKPRFAVIGSFFCGLVVFLAGMYWLIEVSVFGYFMLVLYMAVYILFFGIVCFYYKNFFVIALIWTVLEFIKGTLLGGIPWLLLGVSQYSNLDLIQIADITGVYGVSFVIALSNAFLAECIYEYIRDNISIRTIFHSRYIKHIFKGFLIVFCVILFVSFYGKTKLKKPVEGLKVRIGIVQPNVPQEIKWNRDYTDWMVDRLIILSEQLDECDVMVWPETAVPDLVENRELQDKVFSAVRKFDCPLVVGSQGKDEEGNYYNSAFLISKKGEISGEYRKIHLVPFGEYVPLGEWFPFLRKATPIQGEFTKGDSYDIFELELGDTRFNEVIAGHINSTDKAEPVVKKGGNTSLFCKTPDFEGLPLKESIKFGVLICFEDIFPDLARRFVTEGAEVLLNITNDAWFGNTAGLYQHAFHSVFRAVENRTPLIRATNTGLSCFISSKGRIKGIIKDSSGKELAAAGCMVKEVVVNQGNTFYTKSGNLFCWICVLALLLYFFKRNRKKRRLIV